MLEKILNESLLTNGCTCLLHSTCLARLALTALLVRTAFQQAKQKIRQLRDEKQVYKMQSTALTTALCSDSTDAAFDPSELLRVLEFQQASVAALANKTSELDGVLSCQKQSLVQHILMMAGLSSSLMILKIWCANCTSQKQSEKSSTHCGMMDQLKVIPHERLAGSLAESRLWFKKEAVVQQILCTALEEQQAAKASLLNAESSTKSALDAGVECLSQLAALQRKVGSTQVNSAKLEEEMAELKRNHEHMREELEKCQRELAAAQNKPASVEAAPEVDVDLDGDICEVADHKVLQLRIDEIAKQLQEEKEKSLRLEAMVKSISGGDTGSAIKRMEEELAEAHKQVWQLTLDLKQVTEDRDEWKEAAEWEGKPKQQGGDAVVADGADNTKSVEDSEGLYDALLTRGARGSFLDEKHFKAGEAALSEKAASIMGHSFTRMMELNQRIVVRVWQARAIAATEFKIAELRSGLMSGDATSMHVKGLRLLLQFFHRLYVEAMHDVFEEWAYVANEWRNADSLKRIKTEHAHDVSDLQKQLEAAAAKVSATLEEAAENAAAVNKLKLLHNDLQARGSQTRKQMLAHVVAKWKKWEQTKALRNWAQNARFDAMDEASKVSRKASQFLALLTMQTQFKTLWQQTAQYLMLQWWCLDVLSEKQARRITSAGKKHRELEAKFDIVSAENVEAVERADKFEGEFEKVQSECKEVTEAKETLAVESRRLRKECSKLKKQLSQASNQTDQPGAIVMQSLFKMHNLVIKHYSTFRRALELGKLHAEGKGLEDLEYNDTQLDKAKGASTAVDIITEDAAMIELCTRGFRTFASEVEAARSFNSRRVPASRIRGIPVRQRNQPINREATRESEVLQPDEMPGTAVPEISCAGTATEAQAMLEELSVAPDEKGSKLADSWKQADPADLAGWILDMADKHLQNGQLTMNELESFLPYHPFTAWFMNRRSNLLSHDADRSGALDRDELISACAIFSKEMASAAAANKSSSPESPDITERIKQRQKERMQARPGTAPAPPRVAQLLPSNSFLQSNHEVSRASLQATPEASGKEAEQEAMNLLAAWSTAAEPAVSSPPLAGWSGDVPTKEPLGMVIGSGGLHIQPRNPRAAHSAHNALGTGNNSLVQSAAGLRSTRSFLGVGDFSRAEHTASPVSAKPMPTEVLMNKKKDAEEYAMNKLEAWSTTTPPSQQLATQQMGSLVDLAARANNTPTQRQVITGVMLTDK